jgi:hypothetical protein
MKIIAFGGRKNSGKDTLAKFLVRNRLELFNTESVKIYHFADPLKELAINYLGCPAEWVYGSQEDKENKVEHLLWSNFPATEFPDDNTKAMSVREVLQFYATEIFRRQDPEIWVRMLKNRILEERPDIAIVADMRFPNEVDGIHDLGGKTVYLTRAVPPLSNHESETALLPANFNWTNFSYVLDNNHLDILETERKLVEILREWKWINDSESQRMD